MPFRSSPNFSGRDQELRDVRELLKETEIVGVVACVEGLAGIGKTELALQLVDRLAAADEYPGGLFWFNAEQPDLTSTWGSVVADELGLPEMPIAERAVAAVAHVRQLQEPVLLVLDNVEMWKVGHQPHPLPTGPHIKTLLTTRSRNLGGPRLQHYSLKFLPPTAARELLQRLAGQSIDQQPGFAELIEHLGGHALALELAGAYLAEGVVSPREYLNRMHRGVPLPADIPEQTRYQRTVDEALDLSWARLSEKAREAWIIAAQFEPAPATITLLRACGIDEESMRELSRLHLIEANGTTWEMHRLVRVYGRQKGAGTEAGLPFLLGCAAHAAAIDDSIGFKIYLADRPHLDGAISRAPEVLAKHPAEFSSLLDRIGVAQQSLGSYQEARGLLERALESDVYHFGEEHSNTAASRSNLAGVLRDQDDLEGARELLLQALASGLKQFGENHPDVATRRSNLATVLRKLGDFEGARELLKQALAFGLKQFGEDHPSVAPCRSNLAVVLRDMGDMEGAQVQIRAALKCVAHLPPGSHVRSHVERLARQLMAESPSPKKAARAKASMSTHSAPKSSAASIRPSEAVFADLHADYDSGQLIVFAGAGISMAADLPSWPALATQLRDRLSKEKASAEVISEIDNLIRRGQLIDALSAIERALGATEFNIAIEKAVDDTKPPIPDVAKAIAELKPKLRGVITTNLDRFLERAFNGEWNDVTTAPGNLAQQRQFIWKLHGTRKVRSSWVFTRGQYDRATFGQPTQRGLFEALFRSCPILFVGYGLVDDDFDQTLASIRALSGDQPPQHYALIKGPLGSYQREKLQDSGLRLLEYGEHSEVPAILRALPSGQLAPAK